jgi:tetratricopeptide (TPR) repeat protein
MSTHGQDILKEELKSLVAQSVELARTTDLYVEKVVIKRGWLSRPDVRYDAGALLEYPRSELERIKQAKMRRAADTQASSDSVRRAETLWANGDKNAAIELMQKERRLDPANGEVSYRLAQYLEDAGQKPEALEILKALAERNDGTTWTKLAEARVTAFHNSELSDTFRVIRKHGFASGSIKDVLSWGSEGQVGRARQMGREQYEAVPEGAGDYDDRLPKLVAWYLCSGADVAQTNALAARYDLQKSGQVLKASLAEVSKPQQAEPALLVLLAFIRQGLARDMAYDVMGDLRRQLPREARFSDPLRDLAVLTLNDSQDRRADDFLRWLNAN